MLEVTAKLTPDVEAALRGLKPDALRKAIARGMHRGTLLIKGRIEAQRLTGKGPFPVSQHRLGVVSGRLRQSLRMSGPVVSGDTITTSIGTNVEYAAAHEFGFNGSVKVRAHEVTMTKLFGRKLETPLRFSRLPFTRKVTIPERRPIRAGIEANMNLIEREIVREVTRKRDA